MVARGVTHVRRDLGEGTNNDAEWLALIAALKVAQDLQIDDFVLLGDAQLVIRQAKGEWRCKSVALQAHLDTFLAAAGGKPPRVAYIRRTQNLAGIALGRLVR